MTCRTPSLAQPRIHKRCASVLWSLLAVSTMLGLLASCDTPRVPQAEISRVLKGFTVIKDDPNGSPSDRYEYRTLFAQPATSTVDPLQLLHANLTTAGWKLVDSPDGGDLATKGSYHLTIATEKQYANQNPFTRDSSPPPTANARTLVLGFDAFAG